VQCEGLSLIDGSLAEAGVLGAQPMLDGICASLPTRMPVLSLSMALATTKAFDFATV